MVKYLYYTDNFLTFIYSVPLAKILDKMNLDITAGTTVDDHDLYNAPMLVRKPNTLKRFHK